MSHQPQESTVKSVQFDKVHLIEFAPAVGDNPSCTNGVPVTLSAEPIREREIALDRYERRRIPRRHFHELLLERGVREKMLLSQGYDRKDIIEAIRKCRKARHEREQSFFTQHYDCIHEILEGTQKKLMRLIGLRRSSKDLWTTACGSNKLLQYKLPHHSVEQTPVQTRQLRSH